MFPGNHAGTDVSVPLLQLAVLCTYKERQNFISDLCYIMVSVQTSMGL